jgi:signal transduction histidine kinase
MNGFYPKYNTSSSFKKLPMAFIHEKIKHPKIAACIVFMGLLALSQFLSYQNYVIAENKLKDEMQDELITVKEKLNSFLKSSLVITKTLAYFVENYGEPKNFESIAKHLLSGNKHIDALELTKQGVITHVYPIKGNENVLGYDILKDSFTRKEALRAIQKNELFFAGPLKLKQGDHGIVGRSAIFRDGKFIGFSVVVVKLDALIKKIGLHNSENRKFAFQLSKTNPNTGKEEYFLPNAIHEAGKHSLSIYIPEGKWRIFIHSKENPNRTNLLLLSSIGLIISLLAACFVYYFVNQPLVLSRLVAEKTQQIKETESILRDSLNRIEESFISLNTYWVYTYLNKAAANTHPQGIANVIGKTIWEVHPELLQTPFESAFRKAMQNQQTGSIESYYKPIDKYFYGKIYPSEKGLTIIYQDISEKKRMESELEETYQNIRQLNNYLQTIREEERGNIAREIHDELGQQLTAIKMDTYWLSQKINDSNESISQKIKDMLLLIDETIKTIRKIATELRPGILDDLGLIAALEWLSSETQKRSGITIVFETNLEHLNLHKNDAIGIFRIFQESLTNILRYANTQKVNTSLMLSNKELVLNITDYGVGYSEADIKQKKSFGLSSMKERAIMMGGHLNIKSTPGKGTVIKLILPETILENKI